MGKLSESSASVTRMALDLAKNVFQAHGVDARGEVVLARKVRRSELLRFAGKLLCSPSRTRAQPSAPSGEIAVGQDRVELRRAGSGARDDG